MTDELGNTLTLSIEDELYLALARGIEAAIQRIAPDGPPYGFWPDAFIAHIGRVRNDG